MGYGKSTEDELEFGVDFFRQTGVMLDPVYVGKMIYTFFNLVNGKKPTLEFDKEAKFVHKLRGKNVLLIHTGGQLANFEVNRFKDYFKHRAKLFNCFGQYIDSLKL